MTAVARLILQDFRSYEALDLPVEGQIVALAGENGAGKTNILEALSLFTPGRGLRRAEITAMARQGGDGSFAASITLADEAGRLGIGLGPLDPEGRRPRLARIDGATVGSALAFSDYLRVVWLTPDLDGLFRSAAGDRRRFLDRLVLAIDPSHAARSNALERALRSRNRILEESPHQSQWLDAVEREVAELGVAVAAARAETVARLSAIIAETRDETSPFPFADIALSGEIDALVARLPAVDAEDAYRDLLRQGRQRDRAAGRTLAGPQASDLEVRHGPKDIPAGQGSTGEQKALLIGLVLAHARLVAAMSGIAPLVLLDEIAAHLDPRRRGALYEGLTGLGCQVWMTGADAALFGDLPAGAQRFAVTPGRIDPLD
ncbi:DNA replication/repair protein RecF [Bosea sp. ANAM02]|uniref:DNA replication/repair protein RecF n=1 Tax=Bosea sp. ANAM02 TaxID=2020412 RepID=UPI00140F03F6|nr:DNA replication/repair protein RecF [Bosea sp. ANAM02]BCB17109.1 DNA replication and repair protein RecF [Bosea sp. ANAM02]